MHLETIHILWTGGWDSTFRILELATKPVIIQPYYLKDNRRSEALELETIDLLTKEIRELNTTQCQLNDIVVVAVTDLKEDHVITKAFHSVSAKFKTDRPGQKLGSQYEWLARFAKGIDALELGIEEGSKPVEFIHANGGFLKHDHPYKGTYFVLNKQAVSEDIQAIFGHYHYPLLDQDKLKMKEIAEQKGYINLMNKTWFCHKPIHNKPCGKCNPCMETIANGLTYRFSKTALLRSRWKRFKRHLKKRLKIT